MNNTAIAGFVVILCFFMAFQIAGDMKLVYDKKRFVKYIKEQFEKTLAEKAPEFVDKTPCFTSLYSCKFMEDQKASEYVVIYNQEGTKYYTLFDFFYEEKESVISERVEVTEFLEKDKTYYMDKYKVSLWKSFKNCWNKAKADQERKLQVIKKQQSKRKS